MSFATQLTSALFNGIIAKSVKNEHGQAITLYGGIHVAIHQNLGEISSPVGRHVSVHAVWDHDANVWRALSHIPGPDNNKNEMAQGRKPAQVNKNALTRTFGGSSGKKTSANTNKVAQKTANAPQTKTSAHSTSTETSGSGVNFFTNALAKKATKKRPARKSSHSRPAVKRTANPAPIKEAFTGSGATTSTTSIGQALKEAEKAITYSEFDDIPF